jgi:Cell wall-active antibiotics response 4TMS YvqF
MATEGSNSGTTTWHVSLIGGMKRRGAWRMSANTVSVALVGGANIDLSQAELAAPEVTLTKVSLVGGVTVTVPPGMRVDVQAIHLIGRRRIDTDDAASEGPVLRIRSYSIVGGVDVRTART